MQYLTEDASKRCVILAAVIAGMIFLRMIPRHIIVLLPI
jgi:hypothetical protein